MITSYKIMLYNTNAKNPYYLKTIGSTVFKVHIQSSPNWLYNITNRLYLSFFIKSKCPQDINEIAKLRNKETSSTLIQN